MQLMDDSHKPQTKRVGTHWRVQSEWHKEGRKEREKRKRNSVIGITQQHDNINNHILHISITRRHQADGVVGINVYNFAVCQYRKRINRSHCCFVAYLRAQLKPRV